MQSGILDDIAFVFIFVFCVKFVSIYPTKLGLYLNQNMHSRKAAHSLLSSVPVETLCLRDRLAPVCVLLFMEPARASYQDCFPIRSNDTKDTE